MATSILEFGDAVAGTVRARRKEEIVSFHLDDEDAVEKPDTEAMLRRRSIH